MNRLLHVVLPLVLSIPCACDDGQNDSGPPDADADGDSDSDADLDGDVADPDADLDAVADADSGWVSVRVTATPASITTRETVVMRLEAEDRDGSFSDQTSAALFISSDPAVVSFFESSVGQPLLAGTVTITGSLAGLDDSASVTVTLASPQPGDLLFNEVLADATVDGDPNGDGVTDGVEDEFVEIANASGVTVDLSGALIVENDFGVFLPRHTFAEGTVVRAGEVIVVFGGGSVEALSGAFATFLVADNDDPGAPYGLALNDVGESLRLVADDGTTELAVLAFGVMAGGEPPAPGDASLVLDPEVTGSLWIDHRDAAGSIGDYSPGTFADGTSFTGPDGWYGESP